MFRRLLLSALALLALAPAVARAADPPKLVVYDNDFFGAANTDLLMLLGSPNIKLLGATVVTGDGWLEEETSYALRTLEIAGRTDIPVVKGATFPLVNSYVRTLAWEKAYGKIVWRGAWNDPVAYPGFHPDDPAKIMPDAAGAPTIKATPGTAAQFLIDQVRAHPHQVTVFAAGPLTNIALAIRLDPEFPKLAKELIFMGGFVDSNMAQVTGDADYATDFNIWFDPEAADITLTAPWAKVTVVGNVSNDAFMDEALKARLATRKTPTSDLVVKHAEKLPLWDELTAAIIADPAIVTKEVQAWADVDVSHGLYYGTTHVWPDKTHPGLGEQKVFFVQAVDTPRFLDDLVKAVQGAAR